MAHLFMRDAALGLVPTEAVPHLVRALAAAGHDTLWQEQSGVLMVDSPLAGRVIELAALGEENPWTTTALRLVQKRVHMAGGSTTGTASPRVALTVRLHVELMPNTGSPHAAVTGRRPGMLRRGRNAAAVMADALRLLLPLPVTVRLEAGPGAAEVWIRARLPQQPTALGALASAVWRGIMHVLGGGLVAPAPEVGEPEAAAGPRPDGAPSRAAGVEPAPNPAKLREEPRDACEIGEVDDVAVRTLSHSGDRVAGPVRRARAMGGERRVLWQSEYSARGPGAAPAIGSWMAPGAPPPLLFLPPGHDAVAGDTEPAADGVRPRIGP